MALTGVGVISFFCAGGFSVVGKRLGLVCSVAVMAVGLVMPASAMANPFFDITSPANGDVVNAIPLVPETTMLTAANWSGTPDCDYTGGTLGGGFAPCAGGNEKPDVDGLYSLTVQGTIGAEGFQSETVSFELDSTLPVVSITAITNNATNDSTPTFSFSATDDNLDQVECKIGGSFGLCTSSVSFTPVVPLADSLTSHTLEVQATDAAGNQRTAAYNFFVDTVKPIVNVIYPTAGVTVDSSVPEVNLSIEGANAGSFCRFDDQVYQSCGASWLGGSLADGAHTLWVKGVDVAGNVTEISVPFFVDDTLGATPVPYETSITGGKGGKVKRGKFKVKAGFSLLGPEGSSASILCAAKITATIKPKGGRTYKDRIQLMNKNGRCVAGTTFTLPKRFKGKRAKLTFRYPGTSALGALSRSKTIKKL